MNATPTPGGTGASTPTSLLAGPPNPIAEIGQHRVTLMADCPLVYPELWLEVFVISHGDKREERNFAQMFIKAKCNRAESMDKADLVVFVGGTDVDPRLYDEEPYRRTERPDKRRDELEMKHYLYCLDNGIPMLGVCRGAQFLHVMNGGKLYQHLDGHYGNHSAWDTHSKYKIAKVSSVHHQACIPNALGGMDILMDARGATVRHLDDNRKIESNMSDVEAYFYQDTLCMGVQFHPEYAGYDQCAIWTLNKIQEYIVDCPDTTNETRFRRLRKDVLEQRSLQWEEATALSGGRYSEMADDNVVTSDDGPNYEEGSIMDDIADEKAKDAADLDALAASGVDLPDDLADDEIAEILAEARKQQETV